jgi:allantoate deiminase
MQEAAARASDLGRRIMAWADELGAISEDASVLTRTFLSPPHRTAGERVIGWMQAAGMTARFDAIGNVVGRYEAEASGRPALLLGSHIDTVRDAGKYDGILGVLTSIACIGALHETGSHLPFAIELIAFGDEEGVRFPATLMGSRALAGSFDPAWLDLRDAAGVRLADALAAFGLDAGGIPALARRRDDVLGYVELHIEQGPVLESDGLPLGIVTAIAGCSRLLFDISGVAGHAGTVPMALRHDAGTAAAEIVLAIEARCRALSPVVGTVGQISAAPGAVNVIPGQARLSLDLRAPEDTARLAAKAQILAEAQAICRRRGVDLRVTPIHEAGSAPCADWLSAQLAESVAAVGIRPRHLMSGAGHDAMAVASLTDIAMLFVRCTGGISHNPAEAITTEDAQLGARALLHFLQHFRPKG